jgi:hypothetical protein
MSKDSSKKDMDCADPTTDHSERGFFSQYMKNLTASHLLTAGANNKKEVSNDNPTIVQFAKCASDLERVRFVHNLPFVHSMQLGRYTKLKDADEAKRAKDRGNALFGKAKDMEAVMEYTRGIMEAPWPRTAKRKSTGVHFFRLECNTATCVIVYYTTPGSIY